MSVNTIPAEEGTTSREETEVDVSNGGGLLAEIHLSHPMLPLQPTLSEYPTVRVLPEYRTYVDGKTTPLMFFAVTCEDSEWPAISSDLQTDPTITDVRGVDATADQRVYKAHIAEEAVQYFSLTAETGCRVLSRVGDIDGWMVKLQLPDRDSLVEFNSLCAERDIAVHVRSLRHAEAGTDAVLGLTERQQDLLTRAYNEGYFEIPRGISQDELADLADSSKSAISQGLRRAMKELCRETLPGADHTDETMR